MPARRTATIARCLALGVLLAPLTIVRGEPQVGPQDLVVCTGWHALCTASPDCTMDGDTAACDCLRVDEPHIVATQEIQDPELRRETLLACTTAAPCAVDQAPVCQAIREGRYEVDGVRYDWVSTYSYLGWCGLLAQGLVACDPAAPGYVGDASWAICDGAPCTENPDPADPERPLRCRCRVMDGPFVTFGGCTGVGGGIMSSMPLWAWDFGANTYPFPMPGYEFVAGACAPLRSDPPPTVAAAPWPSRASDASTQQTAVPLADAWATLQPPAVWRHFLDLTQIPRPSHHEERATAFVADFGRRLGLETVVDATGNVIIRKPGTPGMETRPGVVLQAHLDMVPQKTPESGHDFLTDPIRALVTDGWVHADGTTLGADDGIGVAIILALLEADDVAHGPLEALFTVSEEDGPMGIGALAPDALRGRIYLNLDNETEGQYIVSSAGGVAVDAQATYPEVTPAPDMVALTVRIDGLRGGHSGVDIHRGRGNAHELMARLLLDASGSFDLRLAELVGGDTRNAIPRSATAVVAVPAPQLEAFSAYLADVGAALAAELAATDPEVALTATAAELPSRVMAAEAQQALLSAVGDAPQGVLAMSRDVPGLVQTSSNLGVLRIGGGGFAAGALVRSALDAERDAVARQTAEAFERAGAVVSVGGAYASWPPAPASPVLTLMTQVYTDLFGVPPTIAAVHAGLEASVAGAKFPGMDMISLGPTIENAHSPDERLEVAGVAKVYDLLVTTLGRIGSPE